MVSGCSPGWNKFAENGFPDLMNHLATCRSSGQVFGTLAKENDASVESIKSVSFMPCIAKKLETRILEDDFSRSVDFSLTPRELAQMIRQAGITFDNLPESPFDILSTDILSTDTLPTQGGAQFDPSLILKNEEEANLKNIIEHETKFHAPKGGQKGITETMLNIQSGALPMPAMSLNPSAMVNATRI